MATYSFKHTGKTSQDIKTETESVANDVLFVGIKTPLQLGEKTFFSMHETYQAQVRDNFKNLLQTNWGERLLIYKYGANLRPLLADYTSLDTFDDEVLERVRNATQVWMPYIFLDEMVITENKEMTNKMGISVINLFIKYDVPVLSVKGDAIEIILYAF